MAIFRALLKLKKVFIHGKRPWIKTSRSGYLRIISQCRIGSFYMVISKLEPHNKGVKIMAFNIWEKKNGRRIEIAANVSTDDDVSHWLTDKLEEMKTEGYTVRYTSRSAIALCKDGVYMSYVSYPDN